MGILCIVYPAAAVSYSYAQHMDEVTQKEKIPTKTVGKKEDQFRDKRKKGLIKLYVAALVKQQQHTHRAADARCSLL